LGGEKERLTRGYKDKDKYVKLKIECPGIQVRLENPHETVKYSMYCRPVGHKIIDNIYS
jgi:hypothetical protein